MYWALIGFQLVTVVPPIAAAQPVPLPGNKTSFICWSGAGKLICDSLDPSDYHVVVCSLPDQTLSPAAPLDTEPNREWIRRRKWDLEPGSCATVSPDGQQILVRHNAIWSMISIQTGTCVTHPDQYWRTCWRPGGGWIGELETPGAHALHVYRTSADREPVYHLTLPPDQELIGSLSQTEALMAVSGMQPGMPLPMLRLQKLNLVSQGRTPLPPITGIPDAATLRDMALSPDGTRLAVMTTGWGATDNSYQWNSFPSKKVAIDVWIVELAMMHARLVGYAVPVTPKEAALSDVDQNPYFSDLRWSPDNSEVTFLQGMTLYAVPAVGVAPRVQ